MVVLYTEHVLEKWHQSTGQSLKSESGTEVIPPVEWFPALTEEQINPSEVTVKLFLPTDTTIDNAQERIKSAIDHYKQFKQATVNHLILSLQGVVFTDDSEDESTVSDDCIFKIWKTLISVEPNLIEEYGISELSADRLSALLSRIDKSGENIPYPTINHINATDCCALPPNLIQLSKEKGIKLLAHHDPQDLLPKKELNSIDIQGDWNWILRLTYVIKDRQVLSGNEYLISIV